MSIQRTARLVLGIGFLFFLILIFSLFAETVSSAQAGKRRGLLKGERKLCYDIF